MVTIGSDPEFVLVRGRSLVPAIRYFRDTTVGHDGCSEGCDSDGRNSAHGKTGELRPHYSQDVQDHVQRVQECMTTINNTLNRNHLYDVKVKAGSGWRNHPTGGHIHLGIGDDRHNNNYVNVLAKALDYVVGVPLLLNYFMPTAQRRWDYSYGRFGDVRFQPHGVEYRAPASWLVDPISTAASLALAKVVAEEPIEKLMANTALYALPSLHRFAVHERRTFYFQEGTERHTFEGDIYLNRVLQHKVFEKMTQPFLSELENYSAYRSLIRPLFRRIERGKQWWEQRDALVNWHLRPATRDDNNMVENTPQVAQQAAPTTAARYLSYSPTDVNCEVIAQEVERLGFPVLPFSTHIYGLRRSSQWHVTVAIPRSYARDELCERLRIWARLNSLIYAFGWAGNGAMGRQGQLGIGLSRNLRENDIGRCARWVQQIMQIVAEEITTRSDTAQDLSGLGALFG